MGKRIIQQRRGRGTTTYRVRRAAYSIKPCYPSEDASGDILKFMNTAGHSAPLVMIKTNKGTFFNMAVEGIEKGQKIMIGKNAELKAGNVLHLKDVPVGTNVCNIEVSPRSGGQMVRASGLTAVVLRKDERKVVLLMPSKQEKEFWGESRATIGIIAAGGRVDKPFVKAGKRWHLMKARNKLYPRTSPIKMNAVDHPFGGGRGKNMGKSGIAPRWAPPGRKVGLLRPRQTGRGGKR